MTEKEIILKCEGCRRLFHMAAEKFKEGRPCPKCGGKLVKREKKQKDLKLELQRPADDRDNVPRALREGLKDKYKVLHQIGRGGMGVVFKAEQVGLSRVVALKVLIGGQGASPEIIERFVRESQSAGSLRHPNIVQVHDAGVVEGMHYFSMDFIEGVPLDKLMEGKALSTEQALELMIKIARALHFAHEARIVHRDLKPANIIVDFQGEPHIMDFGLSRDFSHASDLSVSGTLIGTPAYMSPEAARGEIRKVDVRSDVYSLGVILYELLTHSQPFQGNTLYDTITRVISDEPRPPRDFNESLGGDLDTIVMKAIEKNPDNRYQTMAALANDMQAYRNAEPISARPVTSLERTWRRLKKHKKALAGVAVALVVILSLLVMLVAKTSYMERLDEQLRDVDAQARRGAVQILANEVKKRKSAKKLEPVIKRLVERLREDPDAEVRLAAAIALSETKAESALSTMRKVATNAEEDVRVRKEAIDFLGNLKDEDSLQPLRGIALGTESPTVRVSAIRALGEIGGDVARRTLMVIYNDPLEHKVVKLAAKEALGDYATKGYAAQRFNTGVYSLKAVKKQREHIERAFAERNKQIEQMMATIDKAGATAQKEKEEAEKKKAETREETLDLSELREALESGNPDERLDAVFALGVLAERETIPWLVEALEDAEPKVSNAAAQALIDMKAVPPASALQPLISHEKWHVRANALRLIAKGGHKDLGDAVLLHLGKESDPRVLIVALQAIGELDPPGARLVLRDLMRNARDNRVRSAAREALAKLN